MLFFGWTVIGIELPILYAKVASSEIFPWSIGWAAFVLKTQVERFAFPAMNARSLFKTCMLPSYVEKSMHFSF